MAENVKNEGQNSKKGPNLQGTAMLAKLFGVSERQIQKLAQNGTLPVVSHNPYKFDLVAAIQSYVQYLAAKVAAREKSEEVVAAEFDKLQAEAGIKTSKSKIAEMQARELEQKMHKSEDVRAMYEDLLLVITEKVMSLPDQIAEKVTLGSTALEASTVIRDECYRILNELAEYEFKPAEAKERRKAHKEEAPARG